MDLDYHIARITDIYETFHVCYHNYYSDFYSWDRTTSLIGISFIQEPFFGPVIPIIEDLLYIYIHMHAIHKTGVDADEGTYVDLNPSLEMSMNSCISVIF